MRWFLPTLGDVLRFSTDDAQALGSWQELPQAGGCAGKASQRMSLYYSDERALSSCEVKRRALTHLLQQAEPHPQAAACQKGQLPFLQKGSFTWKDIAEYSSSSTGPSSSPLALPAQAFVEPLVPGKRQLCLEDEEDKKDKNSKAKKDKKDKKDKNGKKDKKYKDGKEEKKLRQRDRPHRS